VTVSVEGGRPVFNDLSAGAEVIAQLLRYANQCGFAVLAYCAMPNHVHALVEGIRDDADFKRLMHRWKQRTGFDWKRRHGVALWRNGYHDRVLRSDEALALFVAYILENPVRRGLVRHASQYPLSGPHTTAGPAGL
jgi:REP element-mobilizing transposase RayT